MKKILYLVIGLVMMCASVHIHASDDVGSYSPIPEQTISDISCVTPDAPVFAMVVPSFDMEWNLVAVPTLMEYKCYQRSVIDKYVPPNSKCNLFASRQCLGLIRIYNKRH